MTKESRVTGRGQAGIERGGMRLEIMRPAFSILLPYPGKKEREAEKWSRESSRPKSQQLYMMVLVESILLLVHGLFFAFRVWQMARV